MKINLMLCSRLFMMGGFYHKSHILQRQHHVASRIFPQIYRPHIKISGALMGQGCRRPVLVCMEQEKFALRPYVKGVSHLFCFLQDPLKYMSWITFQYRAVSLVNVTDQAGHFSLLRSPRKRCKRIQIRIQVHVRILHPGKSFDRRAVKHTLVVQRTLKLACCHCHILKCAENISKLKPDKSYILFFYHLKNFVSRIAFHSFHASFLQLKMGVLIPCV